MSVSNQNKLKKEKKAILKTKSEQLKKKESITIRTRLELIVYLANDFMYVYVRQETLKHILFGTRK